MSPTPTPLIYRKVRILSIDAAGVTDGILAANALAHLESSLRRKFSDPNAAFFNVVSRLGVGGILAALLFTQGLKDGGIVLGPNGVLLDGLDGGAIPCIVSEEELDKMEGSVATATAEKEMMNVGDLSRRFSGRPSLKRG
ncbi:hypothetical protein FF1_037605 [Malus domestica]